MKIVAVTGCPTGVAHSQMAAESLEDAVEGTEDDIKVEIHGSSGTENILDDEEIEEADAAIIASGISVKSERFDDMPSVHTGVQPAVTDAEKLIEKAKEAKKKGKDKIKYESDTHSKGIFDMIKGLFS